MTGVVTSARRAARLSKAIDRAFGELIEIVPMQKLSVNDVPVADPARPKVTVKAKFDTPGVVTHNTDARLRNDSGTQKRVGFLLTANIDALALPYQLTRGDQVTRLADGTRASVAEAFQDGSGRYVIILSAKAR